MCATPAACCSAPSFALPVIDADTLTIRYKTAFDLMHDLRGMGEANALTERRRNFTRRDVLLLRRRAL